MINFIRKLLCFGLHDWEYSETHNVKECRNCSLIIDLENER